MSPTKDGGRRRHPENGALKMSDPYYEDYIRITNSNAFKRLAHKTQAISLPDSPHLNTRLVHTYEVINFSLRLADALDLNKELCMAIAAGHDIGHVPFGHLGERVLSELGKKDYGENFKFKHYIYGPIIAQHIEDQQNGKGLNLTHETLEGMLRHSTGAGDFKVDLKKDPKSLPEYLAVLLADKASYLISDLEDAVKCEFVDEDDFPDFALKLGNNSKERKYNILKAIVDESKKKGYLSFTESPLIESMTKLKDYMYKEVYPQLDGQPRIDLLNRSYEFFGRRFPGISPLVLVSLCTDNELYYLGKMFMKSTKITKDKIKNLGIMDYLPYLKEKKIDFNDPDLNW